MQSLKSVGVRQCQNRSTGSNCHPVELIKLLKTTHKKWQRCSRENDEAKAWTRTKRRTVTVTTNRNWKLPITKSFCDSFIWIRIRHRNYKRESNVSFLHKHNHCTNSFVEINISIRVSLLYSLNVRNHRITCLLTCHSRSRMKKIINRANIPRLTVTVHLERCFQFPYVTPSIRIGHPQTYILMESFIKLSKW